MSTGDCYLNITTKRYIVSNDGSARFGASERALLFQLGGRPAAAPTDQGRRGESINHPNPGPWGEGQARGDVLF